MPGHWGTRISAAVYIALCFYFGAQAMEFPAGGGTFPLFAEVSAVVICCVMLVLSLTRAVKEKNARLNFQIDYSRAKPMLLLAMSIVYVLLIFELGYFTTTALFLVAASWMIGIRDIKIIAITLAILIPAMYGFFIVFLHAPLPKGMLI